MRKDAPRNVPESIRARLLNLSRAENLDFTMVLTAFATERFLYRLGRSEYSNRFVLKGARLFALWTGRPRRPTRDLDLLGYGDPSPDGLTQIMQTLCLQNVDDDGIAFDAPSVSIEPIRLDKEYDGQRVKLTANLAQARIPVQIDVGYGDIVTPPARFANFTTLLADLPPPTVLVYNRETAIAEKLHAIISLDILNTRMKDFYDLGIFAEEFEYDGPTLCRAIRATFERRNTPIPSQSPDSLRPPFALDRDRQKLWNNFLKRSGIETSDAQDFQKTLAKVREFVEEPLLAAGHLEENFGAVWRADCGWSKTQK